MQEEETLHFEAHVRIDDDSQAIENAGPWRFQIAVLDGEALFDDARRDFPPQLHHVVVRQSANKTTPDEFVT
jgi:hypothetical protein